MNLTQVLNTIGELIALATPIVVALALLVFFWGLVTFLFNAGNADEQKKRKSIMIYGVLVLFVMVSIWGIVNVLDATFLQNAPETITVPTVPR